MRTRRSKQAAFTTMELMVSGAVMLGVIIMGFDVMLAGVQVSQKASNDTQVNEENRALLEKFTQDVQSATAIEAGLNLLGLINLTSAQQQIVLKVPKFDRSGRRLTSQYQMVTYYVKTQGSNKSLVRTTCNYNGLLVSGVSSEEVVLKNVKDIKFSYGRSETITYDQLSNSFPLPGFDTNNENPNLGQVHVTRIRCSWDNAVFDGRSAVSSSGVKWDGSSFIIGTRAAGDTVDVSYFINPSLKKSLLSSEMNANFVKIWVQAKKDSSNGSGSESTMVSTASLRNAS